MTPRGISSCFARHLGGERGVASREGVGIGCLSKVGRYEYHSILRGGRGILRFMISSNFPPAFCTYIEQNRTRPAVSDDGNYFHLPPARTRSTMVVVLATIEKPPSQVATTLGLSLTNRWRSADGLRDILGTEACGGSGWGNFSCLESV